jgi:hypothetical protein
MLASRLLAVQLASALLVGWLVSNALHQPFALAAALLVGGVLVAAFARSLARTLWADNTPLPARQRYIAAGFRLVIGAAVISLVVLVLRAVVAQLGGFTL